MENVLFWLHWFYTNRAGNCPDISSKIQVFDCRLSRCLVRNIKSCYNFSWTVKNIQWFHSCETQMLKYNRNLVKNSSLVVKICGFTFTNTSTLQWSLIENIQWFHSYTCWYINLSLIKNIMLFPDYKFWDNSLNSGPLFKIFSGFTLTHVDTSTVVSLNCGTTLTNVNPIVNSGTVVSLLQMLIHHLEQWSHVKQHPVVSS